MMCFSLLLTDLFLSLTFSFIFHCVSTGLKGSCLCDCVKSYLHQYALIMIHKLAA